jgi:negative regulator of flagellin synthesis FlgM
MKINNAKTQAQAQVTSTRAKDLEKSLTANGQKATAEATSAAGSAKVKMSSEAQAFQKAKAIASESSVDEAKVARLQKLIDAGKYRVDAEAVADRLVDEHLASSGE